MVFCLLAVLFAIVVLAILFFSSRFHEHVGWSKHFRDWIGPLFDTLGHGRSYACCTVATVGNTCQACGWTCVVVGVGVVVVVTFVVGLCAVSVGVGGGASVNPHVCMCMVRVGDMCGHMP